MSSLPVNFSSGSLFGVRNDSAAGSNPEPVQFGVLQDVTIDFDGSLKQLYGQYQFPQDVARGEIKVSGKAKTAQIFSSYFDLFFGEGVTLATALDVVVAEAHTVPGSSTYTCTATHSAQIVDDLGVTYQTTGLPFQKVSSVTAVGQYSYSAGVYTFYSTDASAAVLINYTYTGTNANEIVVNNQLMGTAPTFFAVLATTYKGTIFNLKLNNCISEKLSMPITNKDYTIFVGLEVYATMSQCLR